MLKVVTIEKALEELERHFGELRLESETIPVIRARGRFLAGPVDSPVPVPHFPRSTRDGYAVRAAETAGAGETMPALFTLLPDVEMGRPCTFSIGPGQAAYVPTGGMVPEGADCVVMVEYSELLGTSEVALNRPSAPGENVIPIGLDIPRGARVLDPGHRLSPSDLGVVTACGFNEVTVYKKPRISILSTGDELREPGTPGESRELPPGEIRDINTYTLAAQAERMGFQVVKTAVAGDDLPSLIEILRELREESDLVFLSGGSSAGKKDYSIAAFDALGKPGSFIHGIAFNPGKPTILADAGGFPLVGLPGHPVSALMVFLIIARAFLFLMNHARPDIQPSVPARLSENVHASPGRDTFRLVTLEQNPDLAGKAGSSGLAGHVEYTARPVHGDSGMITVLSQAQGYVHISRDSEGMVRGTEVRVILL